MERHRYIDLSVGLFLVLGVGALLLLALKVSGISSWGTRAGYLVTAKFSNIGGLKVRAPVTVAGVKIGEVTGINLQPGSLHARVTMALRADKPIPYGETTAHLTQGCWVLTMLVWCQVLKKHRLKGMYGVKAMKLCTRRRP